MIVAKTRRLTLKQFSEIDAQGLYRLNSNPQNTLNTGANPFPDVASAKNFINNYQHYQQHGYGYWALQLNNTGQFIGFCGLNFHQDSKETSLGYSLEKDFWGMGFASEASRCVLDMAFEKYGLEHLIARCREANPASIRILEKMASRASALTSVAATNGCCLACQKPNSLKLGRVRQ